ncbi:ras family-domain-containing protein [Chytriomyces sp. MP71]|nr:ras family-domain-containing protein [Chytriomyces sp. MP71]
MSSSDAHEHMDPAHVFKVITLGDASVGKTNLIARFVSDTFKENTMPTIGVECHNKDLTLQEKVIRAKLFDTAGQERFCSINSVYYRGAAGIILCYDVTNKNSFLNIKNWLKEVRKHFPAEDDTGVQIVLLGNKVDLAKVDKEFRKVGARTAKEFADENGFLFYEVSALSGENVDSALHALCQTMLETHAERETKRLEALRAKASPTVTTVGETSNVATARRVPTRRISSLSLKGYSPVVIVGNDAKVLCAEWPFSK